jgi:hypothetical protein
MSDNPYLQKWTAKGNELITNTNGTRVNTSRQNDIPINELDRSFTMPGYGKAPAAGIPVDANTAIFLIRKFHQRLLSFPRSLYDKNEAIPAVPLNPADIQTFREWITNLLIFSKAITLDKNIILKTLSQPGCEGVRFYLCLKDHDSMSESEIEESGEHKEIFSLVTVGVDDKGRDIHYKYPEGENQGANSFPNIKNESLTSEYGYPPPPRALFTKENSRETYVLGEIAWGDFYDKLTS